MLIQNFVYTEAMNVDENKKNKKSEIRYQVQNCTRAHIKFNSHTQKKSSSLGFAKWN